MKRKILSFLLIAAFIISTLPFSFVMAQDGAGEVDEPVNVPVSETGHEGLFMGKVATPIDDDTYRITLEAFTTGEVKTEVSTVPLDIVLVLDQSGSMADKIDSYTYNKSDANVNEDLGYSIFGYWQCYDDLYYYDATTEQYIHLTVETDEFGWGSTYTYTWGDSIATSFGDDGAIPEPLKGNIYTRTTTKIRKNVALKSAVSGFIEMVQQNALGDEGTDDDVDHRIAIVGFASESGYGNNTELFDGSTSTSYNNITSEQYAKAFQSVLSEKENLEDSIKALDTNGATRSDLGLVMAQNIFSNDPYEPSEGEVRQKVVIMFTDGVPTNSGYFQDSIANEAIKTAQNLKTSGATVYTIGIYDGANPEDTSSNNNRYMNYVSSNYPNASNMWNGGERKSNNYFMAASTADRLNEIFEQISDDTIQSSVNLSESAVIDIVTEKFDAPANADNIHVYTADATVHSLDDEYKDNDKWGERVDVSEDVEITIEADSEYDPDTKNKISVKGFDFNANFVRSEPKEGTVDDYGKKLIIEFDVTRKDGFIGGNAVPTNAAWSGVYSIVDGEETEAGRFISPEVDVPIKFNYDARNQTIFIGENADLESRIYLSGNLVESPVPGEYEFDGIINEFVNVEYKVYEGSYDDISNIPEDAVPVGTYTVAAGSSSSDGTWDSENGLKPDLKEETNYTVVCTVSSIKDPADAEHPIPDNVPYIEHFTVFVKSGTLTINKTGGKPGEMYIFNVTKDRESYADVTVTAGEDGTGSVTLTNLPEGTYTVEEDSNWAWRYSPDYEMARFKLDGDDNFYDYEFDEYGVSFKLGLEFNQAQFGTHTLSMVVDGETIQEEAIFTEAEINCNNNPGNDQWLNSYAYAENVYGEAKGGAQQ